jgi:hypothetical protein
MLPTSNQTKRQQNGGFDERVDSSREPPGPMRCTLEPALAVLGRLTRAKHATRTGASRLQTGKCPQGSRAARLR